MLALATAIVFHSLNVILFFDVEIFPWVMIAATILFLEPSWPRAFIQRSLGVESTPASNHCSTSVMVTPLKMVIGFFWVFYCAAQVSVPLRHWLYDGDVAWTEEGNQFAWRMMLRAKRGVTQFAVVAGGDTTLVVPSSYLSSWQEYVMAGQPELILQFARHVAKHSSTTSVGSVHVYVDAVASLNGRPPRTLVSSNVNLAALQPRLWEHSHWILPER